MCLSQRHFAHTNNVVVASVNPNREIDTCQLQSCSERPDELIYNSTLMKQMCNGFARSE